VVSVAAVWCVLSMALPQGEEARERRVPVRTVAVADMSEAGEWEGEKQTPSARRSGGASCPQQERISGLGRQRWF